VFYADINMTRGPFLRLDGKTNVSTDRNFIMQLVFNHAKSGNTAHVKTIVFKQPIMEPCLRQLLEKIRRPSFERAAHSLR